MAQREPARFLNFEYPDVRARKLNQLLGRVCDAEYALEESSPTGPPDPGDLTVYFDNGRT